MMRLFFALLLLCASPALGADWGHYVNVRYGYAIDVPPGFAGHGEADNGDGQVFSTPTATLRVYGANILEGDFETAAHDREAAAADDGWASTYQVSTPNRASFSGQRGGRIVYGRLIALCAGTELAAFELDYSKADLQKFSPVVDRLVQSFRATDGSAMCG